MLQSSIKTPVVNFITPICRFLLKIRLTANIVSALGGIGSTAAAIYFFSRGKYFIGMVVSVFFVLFDVLDGTMARLSEQGTSRWGALLDSTLDRVTDSAVLGSLAFYLSKSNDRLVPVLYVALVSGLLISYIKARAEGLGIKCDGGIAERTERLLIIFFALGFAGLHLAYALTVGVWALTLISLYTVGERLLIVYRATR